MHRVALNAITAAATVRAARRNVGKSARETRLSGGNVALALLANTLATGGVLVAIILTFGGKAKTSELAKRV